MTDVVASTPAEELAAPRARGGFSPAVGVALVVLAAVVLCAIFGEWIAPYDPNEQDLLNSLMGPSRDHLLGTDDLGRDILSRTIVGARTAVVGPVAVLAQVARIGRDDHRQPFVEPLRHLAVEPGVQLDVGHLVGGDHHVEPARREHDGAVEDGNALLTPAPDAAIAVVGETGENRSTWDAERNESRRSCASKREAQLRRTTRVA